jgi:hypothetical protein
MERTEMWSSGREFQRPNAADNSSLACGGDGGNSPPLANLMPCMPRCSPPAGFGTEHLAGKCDMQCGVSFRWQCRISAAAGHAGGTCSLAPPPQQ